jgi:hypothetical protein
MNRLIRRARTWFALAVVLAIVGLVILDGSASGVALAAAAIAAFVGVLRVLSNADMSGVTHGGEGGGFG